MMLKLGGILDYKVVQRIFGYRVTVHQNLIVVTL